MASDEQYLICEKNWVYYTLMAVSGFYGAFTYLLRGNVFCNAQTGNVVLLGLALGQAKWGEALYYLFPISAYLLGAMKLMTTWEICTGALSGRMPKKITAHISMASSSVSQRMRRACFTGFGSSSEKKAPSRYAEMGKR